MALLLSDKSYLVVDTKGRYTIFKNTNSRNKFKKSVKAYEVLAKYDELLYDLLNDKEAGYYNAEEHHNTITALEEERVEFLNAANRLDRSGTYPLIEKYIPKVNEAIPCVLMQGKLPFSTETEEEMYNLIKELKIFDVAKDC